jgi:hypothetical protein
MYRGGNMKAFALAVIGGVVGGIVGSVITAYIISLFI